MAPLRDSSEHLEGCLIVDKGFVVWLTGFSGSGNTTLARTLEKDLSIRGISTEVLDGDELRQSICQNFVFQKVIGKRTCVAWGSSVKYLFAMGLS